jgi:hypothetical protein
LSPRAGRSEPYTERGIGRLACVRCGHRAEYQWQCCADGNKWRPICGTCDVALNLLALEFMRDPDSDAKIERYAREKLGEVAARATVLVLKL